MGNKIKKIGAFVCALIVVANVFVCTPYLATENDGSPTYKYALCAVENQLLYEGDDINFQFPSKYGQYTNYVLVRLRDGSLTLILTNSDSIEMICRETKYSGKICYKFLLKVKEGYCRSTDGGATWSGFLGGEAAIEIGVVDPDTMQLYVEPNCIVDNSIPIYFDDYEVFNKTVESYKPEIGYLKDARLVTTWISNNYGSEVDYSSFRHTLKFSGESTNGVDIVSGDYVIRVYGQMAYHKTTTSDMYDEDFPIIYFGDFEILNNSITYMSQDLYEHVSNSTIDPYNSWDILTKGISRSDNYYYQIYNKNTHEYGGYLKVTLGGAEGSTYSQTTLDEKFEVDTNGFVDKNLIGSSGSGTNYEDAEVNADKNYNDLMNNGGVQGLEGAINAFTSTLGVVPRAIGSVFSFLPSWCLDLWGVAFGLIAVLIVYKVLRG